MGLRDWQRQAAVPLAEFLTGSSPQMRARSKSRMLRPRRTRQYHVTPAEHSDLERESVDLITVAQALHWFDCDAFYAEAKRVLKPDGVLAVWSYNLSSRFRRRSTRSCGIFTTRSSVRIGRRSAASSRRTIPRSAFPFEEIDAPAFQIEAEWTLEHLLGYLRTWSATQRFMRAKLRSVTIGRA